MNRFVRHVVMFCFKRSTETKTIREIEEAFAALPDRIEEIRDFEWGSDVSVEDKAGGFSHCFLVTFGSEKDRDTYIPHPSHQGFVPWSDPT